MSDPSSPADDAGYELISRLRIIEEQPLADRAAAYAGLHDELARRLESAPTEPGARG
jgi:hypothetical protein